MKERVFNLEYWIEFESGIVKYTEENVADFKISTKGIELIYPKSFVLARSFFPILGKLVKLEIKEI